MIIRYGLSENNIVITEIVKQKSMKQNIAFIPSDDLKRARLFSDPLPEILKSIFIDIGQFRTIYDNTQEIYIDFINEVIFTENFPEYIMAVYPDLAIDKKLQFLQSNLKLDFGNFSEELPEQKMVVKYFTGYEKVLEIGGNIGRNSLISSSIMNKQKNKDLVVLETDPRIYLQLIHNKDINNLVFYIENSALSKRNLIQRGWETIVSDELLPGYQNVKTITWEQLNHKYNIEFDTLILDCEGAFYYILKDMPEILNNIKLILMENDYNDISHKQYINAILRKHNFYIDHQEGGGWGPCRDFFFEAWKKNLSNLKPANNSVLSNNYDKWFDVFMYFIESELSPTRDIPIGLNIDSKEDYIFYNTEQLTRPHQLQQVLDKINLSRPKEVWDYSKANCEILKNHNIDALHIPLDSPEWYLNKLKGFINIQYDVGFCGEFSQRRISILDGLEKAGVSVQRITDFGEVRDQKLASCRVILNIHFDDDYLIFESCRCEPWLKLGAAVISEKSLDDDPRCIICEYDSLIETTINYLNNLKKI